MSQKKQARKYLQSAVPGERSDVVSKYMPLPNPAREYTQTRMSFAGIDRSNPFSMSSEAQNIVFEAGIPKSVPAVEEILDRYEYVESIHGFDNFFLIFYLKPDEANAWREEKKYNRWIDYIIPETLSGQELIKIPVTNVNSSEYDESFDYLYWNDENHRDWEDNEYFVAKDTIKQGYVKYSVETGDTITVPPLGNTQCKRSAVLFNTASDVKVVTSVTFKKSILVFPEKYLIELSEENGEKSLKVTALADTFPDLYSATAFNGRLYGVDKNGVVYVSQYNAYDGWELDTSENISSSHAWVTHTQTNPGSGAEFMSIIPFASKVLALKDGTMYTVYGNSNPFRIKESSNIGTIDPRSVCVVSDSLFFLAKDGVYSYDSYSLTRISDNLGFDEFTAGIAASCEGRYYLFANGELFVYDTYSRAWSTVHCDGEIYGLASVQNTVYGIISDGRVLRISGPENGKHTEFSVVTAGLIGSTLADRRIKEVNAILELSEDAVVNISVILNDSDGRISEKLIGTVMNKQGLVKKRYRLNLPAAMCAKLKISGYGAVRIIAFDVSHTFI